MAARADDENTELESIQPVSAMAQKKAKVEEHVAIVHKSVLTVLKYSTNENFRQEVLHLLKVDDSQLASKELMKHLHSLALQVHKVDLAEAVSSEITNGPLTKDDSEQFRDSGSVEGSVSSLTLQHEQSAIPSPWRELCTINKEVKPTTDWFEELRAYCQNED